MLIRLVNGLGTNILKVSPVNYVYKHIPPNRFGEMTADWLIYRRPETLSLLFHRISIWHKFMNERAKSIYSLSSRFFEKGPWQLKSTWLDVSGTHLLTVTTVKVNFKESNKYTQFWIKFHFILSRNQEFWWLNQSQCLTWHLILPIISQFSWSCHTSLISGFLFFDCNNFDLTDPYLVAVLIGWAKHLYACLKMFAGCYIQYWTYL